jgi:NADH dehydrogenase
MSAAVTDRASINQAAVPAAKPRVVIIGAGFGGLAVARHLKDAPVDVLLLDRTNYHLFTPLLYQVATGGLEPEEIAHPVRRILRGVRNVRFRVAEVHGVNLDARVVETDAGPQAYDYLVLAAGSATNFFGLAAPAAKGMKDLREALALRNHILQRVEQAAWEPDQERRRALLTFVVVGGGPTGVEMAGALAELLRLALPRDFPMLDFSEARVLLLEATDTILAPFRPKLRDSALRALRNKGIDVRLGARVARVDDTLVELASGERIEAGTLVWAAGVRAADLASALDVPKVRAGRLAVDRTLRLPNHPEVFVVGDMAGLEQDGQPLPMLIPVALQEGKHVAGEIHRALSGEHPLPFRYNDPGTMATIGRNAGIAQIGPLSLSGFIGWLAWLGLHLLRIIGFRNRLLVLINWVWDYWFYDRAVRLIVSPSRTASSPPPLQKA